MFLRGRTLKQPIDGATDMAALGAGRAARLRCQHRMAEGGLGWMPPSGPNFLIAARRITVVSF